MPATATAAVVTRPEGPFRLGAVELDGPRDDEVLVRVEACGICHTDLTRGRGPSSRPGRA